MSNDKTYHARRARSEISAGVTAEDLASRHSHFDLADLHITRLREVSEDAIDRMEANCVASVLGYWRRCFSENAAMSGVEMLEKLRASFRPEPSEVARLHIVPTSPLPVAARRSNRVDLDHAPSLAASA